MGKRCVSVTGAFVAALTLFFAPAALGSTEVGSRCEINDAQEGVTFIPIFSAPTNPLPVTTPVAGVATQWKMTFPAGELPLGIFTQTMKVFRATAVPNRFQVVGESLAGGLRGGPNVFPTRIPVQAGDRFGLTGTPATLFCHTTSAADVIGGSELSSAVGGLQEFETEANLQVPVVAVIEPDVDVDGYGDETQDGCPQSAAYQTPCPVILLDAISQVGGSSVTVLVSSSLSAPVKVTGKATLGKGSTATITKTQTVSPGKLARVKLKFPGKLKTKLKELEPSQKLTLRITASATNLVGAASSDKLKAKLKGQG